MSTTPYAEALGDHDPQQVIAATPARLAAILHTKTPGELEARPAPGKWNLREIMAHLADCEIAWAWCLRIAYEKDHAPMQPFDQDPWARIYDHYTFAAAQTTFNALRAWNLAFIAGLTPADKAKSIVHPERGEETLWTLVEIIAGHDLHHLKALEPL